MTDNTSDNRPHLTARARRIVAGVDAQGRSTFVSDGDAETRVATDAYTINQIWQATAVPTPVRAESTLGPTVILSVPVGGYQYDVTIFPPDSSWDYEAGYAKALAEAGAPDATGPDDIPGMHETDTIDIVTIISGEIWAIVETGETLMRAGDTIVHRGNKHAWRNRSDQDCKIAALHVSITR